uniref:VWFA domain-containing protein n=1 Tax=Piliocolobus tephrosceles TaxID=591936 RepID=A0A8C9H0I8_9PRIM
MSGVSKMEWDLSRTISYDKKKIIKKIEELSTSHSCKKDIAKNLRYLRTHVFSKSRSNKKKQIVMLVEGTSNTDLNDLRKEVELLKIYKINLFVYAIDTIDETEYKILGDCESSNSTCKNIYKVSWDKLLSTAEIQNDYICKQYPANAQCSEWGEWSACPNIQTCKQVFKKRERKGPIITLKEAEYNLHGVGNDCNDLGSIEYKECPIKDNCSNVCGEFGEWSQCSATCGDGIRIRRRENINNSETCKEVDSTIIEKCNVQECNVIDTCKDIGEWDEWSQCTKECGYSTRERHFVISDSDLMQHQYCANYNKKETMVCSVPRCNDEKCFEWGDWEEWSGGSCGTRTRIQRARLSIQDSEHSNLNKNDCEDHYENKVELDEGKLCTEDLCGHWSEWSECNKTCGVGVKYRRFISNLSILSGKENELCLDYMNLVETEPCLDLPLCNSGECNEWETFVSCENLQKESTSCHVPNKRILTRRLDLLKNIKNNVSPECVDHGYFKEEECTNLVPECNDALCNEWKEWGDCSEPCGTSKKYRSRKEPLELIPAKLGSNGKMGLSCLEQNLKIEETSICDVPKCISSKDPELDGKPNNDKKNNHEKTAERVTLGAGIIGLILLAAGGIAYGHKALNGGEEPDSSNMEFESTAVNVGDGQEVTEDFEVIDANDPMWS